MLISDLFESAPNYDLQGKYDEFNRLYFNGELPRIPLSFKPLKTVGGMVKAKVSRSDPEHPTLVRLGKPKYRKSVLDRDSLQLVLSTAYARAPEDIDAILLHEMIHVWELAVAGDLDGNHGKTFLDKLKEVRAASGIDVPITDSTKGLELVNAAVSSVGVILRPISGGRYAFLMMSTQAIQRALPDIKELAQDKVEVYMVDSPLWIEKSQRMPLQRSFSKDRRQVNKAGQIETVKGYNFNLKWYMADEAAIADLKANGKLLWLKESLSEGVTEEDGMMKYTGHGVTAFFTIGDQCIAIYEFSSSENKAEAALRELRSYGRIDVIDPGKPDSPSFNFWVHMKTKGLVNRLLDEDYRPLTEAPISDVRHIGAWGPKDRNSSFKDKVDRRLVSHPSHVERMKNVWKNTEQNFNILFVNNAEGRKFQELGRVDYSWLEENMPRTVRDPMFKIDHDAINILFTNNGGSERVPMTPWIMAHRFGHAIGREYRNFAGTKYAIPVSSGAAAWDWKEAMDELENFINQCLECYRAPTFNDDAPLSSYGGYGDNNNIQMRWTIRRKFLQAIGTFKSAREGSLREYFEFHYEMFAQYLLKGEIKFNPLPRSFKYGNTTYVWKETDHDFEYYNQGLETMAESIGARFADALARSVGKIYVM